MLSVISLSATFGAMVWIFQEGHLSGLLDFTPTGTLIDTMPILMFCVAFGLSMDYEVFLVSRMKELHDNGADNDTAIAGGMQQTGRIITAAALLMSIIFLSLLSSSISFIKLFAVGLALAVLMDAFIIRGMLVPAIMKLAGDANWWAPSFMRKVAPRPRPIDRPLVRVGSERRMMGPTTRPDAEALGIDRGRIGCADPARLSSHSGKGGFPNEAFWSVRSGWADKPFEARPEGADQKGHDQRDQRHQESVLDGRCSSFGVCSTTQCAARALCQEESAQDSFRHDLLLSSC